MKFVICMDSFKGSLDALSACEAVGRGILAARPDARITVTPIADGGEGTASVILRNIPGRWIPVPATGPLDGMRVEAGYARLDDGTAVVEMATASGLPLLRRDPLNPLVTTTFGTGELIRAAVEARATKILLAVGGSATVDGGVGAAAALGWRFLDARGRPLGPGGGELRGLARIEAPAHIALPPVDVLCDVDNPLVGPRGAARVFGPQKGATPEMVGQLEAGLERLALVVREQIGADIRAVPGAGAAGGLAGGAVAFLGARLVPGIDAILNLIRLPAALNSADWVITGEGSFDEQSLRGKAVSGVARAARERGVRVAVMAGVIRLDPAAWRRHGIESAVSLAESGTPAGECIARAAEILEATAKRWADMHL